MSDEFSRSVETSFDAWLAEDSTHWIGEQDAAWQAWMYVHEQAVDPLNDEIAQIKAENAGLKTGYEAYERVNSELKAECESLRNSSSCVDDLSAIVRKLVRQLRKAAPGNDLPEKAMDYLKRKGLQGSPMRKINAAMSKENPHG